MRTRLPLLLAFGADLHALNGKHSLEPHLCGAWEQLGTGNASTLSSDGNTIPGNLKVGTGITNRLSFYGVTPITQRAAAAQATSLVATASSTDVTSDLKAALIEVMNTLTALGLWKGAA